ncbi:MAG: EamA family transporter [Candidatus Bathyarchaeia archaeon]
MEYMWFCMLAFILWGTLGFFIKILSAYVHTETISMITYAIGALLIASYVTYQKIPISVNKFTLYACTLGIVTGVAYLSWCMAVKKGPISVVVPIMGVYPVLTAVLGFIFLHEEMTATKIAGIILACLAIVLLSK